MKHESTNEPVALRDAVSIVLEGFTLPQDVRKILETAYYAQPLKKLESKCAFPEVCPEHVFEWDQKQEQHVARIEQRFYEDGTLSPCVELKWVGRKAEDDFPVGTKFYTHPQDQKKDEALRLALEAVKKANRRAAIMGSTGAYREGQIDALKSVSEDLSPAITLIEQALENK